MQPIIIDVEAVAISDVETYIDPCTSAPDNYKRPEAISAYIAEANAKAIEKAALDVDLAQIVCLGVAFPQAPVRVKRTCDMSEADILSWLWDQWREYSEVGTPMLVTFNGLGYDVPLLLRRSMYLGVKAPYISCDKYRHPQQIDLMSILSMQGKLKAHSLQFYLNRFGYTHGSPDITGAEIAERYAAGDWAAIEQHCRMDVEATAWLAERIGAIPKRAARTPGREHTCHGGMYPPHPAPCLACKDEVSVRTAF